MVGQNNEEKLKLLVKERDKLFEKLQSSCTCVFNAEWPDPPKDLSKPWAVSECPYHRTVRDRIEKLHVEAVKAIDHLLEYCDCSYDDYGEIRRKLLAQLETALAADKED